MGNVKSSRKKGPEICVVSFPMPSALVVNVFSYNLVEILELICERIYVVTSNIPKDRTFSEKILSEVGAVVREKKILLDNDFKMPHKYSLFAVARILIEKSRETKFRRSLIKQMLYMLINPRLSKWVQMGDQ